MTDMTTPPQPSAGTPRTKAPDRGTESLGATLRPLVLHRPPLQRPYPLPRLPPAPLVARTGSSYAVVTPVDAGGRLADRSPLRHLRWGPGHPVTIGLNTTAISVVADHPGRQTIAGDGYLRLPAGIRSIARLHPGDRLLAVACPDGDLLLLYPMPLVEAMILAYHQAQPADGDP